MAQGFLEQFLDVQIRKGWSKPLSPSALIDSWRDFVDLCTTGYDMSIYEYQNDLGVRRQIEAVLQDQRIASLPEMEWVKREINGIDERFRALLLPERLSNPALTEWWELHPPRLARQELADDLRATYGVDVAVADD